MVQEVRSLRQLREFLNRTYRELVEIRSRAEEGGLVRDIYAMVRRANTNVQLVLGEITGRIRNERLREALEDLVSELDTLYKLLDDRISEDPAFISLNLSESRDFRDSFILATRNIVDLIEGLINSLNMIIEVLSEETQNQIFLKTESSPTVSPSTITVTREPEARIPSQSFIVSVEYRGERATISGVASFLLGRDGDTNRLVIYELDADTYQGVLSLIQELNSAAGEFKRDVLVKHKKGTLYVFGSTVPRTVSREQIGGLLSEIDSSSILLFDVGKNATEISHSGGVARFPGQRSGNFVKVFGEVRVKVAGMEEPIILRRLG